MIEYVASFRVGHHIGSTSPYDLEHVRFTSPHDCYDAEQMDDLANDAHAALNAIMLKHLGRVIHEREWVSCMPAVDFDKTATD